MMNAIKPNPFNPDHIITTEDLLDLLDAQRVLLVTMLTPTEGYNGITEPYGYHSDDGADYLDSALDIYHGLFACFHADADWNSMIRFLDATYERMLTDDYNGDETKMLNDAHNDDLLIPFASDAITPTLNWAMRVYTYRRITGRPIQGN